MFRIALSHMKYRKLSLSDVFSPTGNTLSGDGRLPVLSMSRQGREQSLVVGCLWAFLAPGNGTKQAG